MSTITTRLNGRVHRRLREIANENDCSMNQLLAIAAGALVSDKRAERFVVRRLERFRDLKKKTRRLIKQGLAETTFFDQLDRAPHLNDPQSLLEWGPDTDGLRRLEYDFREKFQKRGGLSLTSAK